MTDIDVYQPAAIEPYRAGLAMTPEAAMALDDQLRLCTRAVLREGTDYGVIPGTGGRNVLFKPGAEKLLQWFGFGFTCDRVEVEVDDDGQKAGVTYRCTVIKRLADGAVVTVTTCEGYAGYDEERFYKPVTDAARHKAEARERGYAEKDRRPADPTKWKNLAAYRAPWNTVIKMAQKRAIVGATIDATAAAGLFGQEDDQGPVDDATGQSWYELASAHAGVFTTVEDGRKLYAEAAQAARDGLCTPGQATHVQNRVKVRVKLLQETTALDVDDIGRQDEAGEGVG